MNETITAPETSAPETVNPEITTDAALKSPVAPVIASKEKMYKMTVNGKEELWPESKVLERASKAEGAEAAMKKGAQYEQAFTAFISRAQDPAQLLELLNSPVIKYDEDKQEALVTAMLSSKKPRIIEAVKKWLWENEVEPASLTPEEREMRRLKKFEEEQLRKNQEVEDVKKKEQEEKAIEEAWNNYRISFGQELQAQGIPLKEANVARVARYAMLYRKMDRPVDVKDCVARVKKDLLEEFKAFHGDATEDNILDRFDEDTAKKINAAFLKKLTKKEEEKIESKELPQRRPRQKERTREEKRAWAKNLSMGKI